MLKFWMLMLIPSAIASDIVYDIRSKKGLKILVAVVAVCLGGYGIVFIEGLETYSLIMECFLLLLIGMLLFKKDEKARN